MTTRSAVRNIRKKLTAYLIGIKGVGMTALAQLLQAQGMAVSGSDTTEKFFTDAVLKRHRIPFREGFSAGNLPPHADLVVASAAYGNANPEIAEARRRHWKIRSYAEALGEFFNRSEGIAVCGSHGKTTTTALLGFVFRKGGLDPTVVVGSEVPQFGGNAITGGGRHFIAEVDEYQNKLRHFSPRAALLTNVDYDHPDFFRTPGAYRRVFRDFIARLPGNGFLVAWGGDPAIISLLPKTRARLVLYDLAQPPGPRLKNARSLWHTGQTDVRRGRWQFTAYKNTKLFGRFSLRLAGRHNVLNALGVIATAEEYGIPRAVIRRALAKFRGTRRRFEHIGRYRQALLIDDYAHHPAEIRATLEAARELYGRRRLIAVFQAHTYSRTKALLDDFSQSFGQADEVIVLDIYGSARERSGNVTSGDLVEKMKYLGRNVRHLATIKRAARYLKNHLQKGDVAITMGAGDVWKVHQLLRHPSLGVRD